MEFLLLWVDELDDALGALRHLAPRILGFFAAIVLFAVSGIALVFAPHALALIVIVLCASLLETVRRRRLRAIAQRNLH